MELNVPLFLSRVNRRGGGECWPWTGTLDRNGYGLYGAKEHRYAHRVAWKLWRGDLPPELDHLCRVRHCVNPAHLEPVTHGENLRRGALARTGGLCRCGAPREVKAQCHACYNAYMRDYRRGERRRA